MLTYFRRSLFRRARLSSPQRRAIKLQLESLSERVVPSTSPSCGHSPSAPATPVFVETNLVSDIPGMAANTDPLLVNPWGIAASGGSPFWVSDNNSGFSTLYNGQGVPQPAGMPLQVTIPPAPGDTSTIGSPTGVVFNTDTGGFVVSAGGTSGSSIFLFASEGGGIFGWSPMVNGTQAIQAATVAGADFTGLAMATDAAGQTLLYAVDNAHGVIDVFDSSFNLVTTLAGNFTDPNLPKGADPFNIQNIGGNLYVEYQVSGTLNVSGAVDVFTPDGQPVNPTKPLIVGGPLDSPWGITMAPSTFGQFGGDLLVGNFGNGNINAFTPTGTFVGKLTLANGQPFQEDNLWSLTFGNGGASSSSTLYFTAGINAEKDGLLGSLQAVSTVQEGAPIVTNLTGTAQQTISTIPPNGDTNPYGAAYVPQGFNTGTGVLQPGDLLVSNFNDSAGVQGTGSTIVRITPNGEQSVFFQGGPGLGLTTALGVLKNGFVIVGNVPTINGVAQQGSLLILNSSGQVVSTLTSSTLLDGPWDLAINDPGNCAQVFVSNVLSGTVTRIDLNTPNGGIPQVVSETQIASGYAINTNPAALVVGPTGLAFDQKTGTLYVASTDDNAIYAIKNAAFTMHDHGTGKIIYDDQSVLHGPLGLVLAPNGDLIFTNGDAINANPSQSNEIVEITPCGKLVGEFQLDTGAPGAAFGIAITEHNGIIEFAAVDDNTNTVEIWTLQEVENQNHHHDHDHHGDNDHGDNDQGDDDQGNDDDQGDNDHGNHNNQCGNSGFQGNHNNNQGDDDQGDNNNQCGNNNSHGNRHGDDQ